MIAGEIAYRRGEHEEALAVYTRDLEIHPNNPWALHGLAESLAKLGREAEAERRRGEYRAACARSDVAIDRSCYCRLSVE